MLVKNLPAMQETRVKKIRWRTDRLPTPVFWPGEFHGESDMTEQFSIQKLNKCNQQIWVHLLLILENQKVYFSDGNFEWFSFLHLPYFQVMEEYIQPLHRSYKEAFKPDSKHMAETAWNNHTNNQMLLKQSVFQYIFIHKLL